MNIFVSTYNADANFDTTIREGVFGAPTRDGKMKNKFMKLEPGDIIAIRRRGAGPLRFFDHCRVMDDPYDEKDARIPRLLWPDEIAQGQCLYPFRAKVDFQGVPRLPGLYTSDWEDWLSLKWTTESGHPYKQGNLRALFTGNFVPPLHLGDRRTLRKLLRFLETPRPLKPDRRDRTGYVGEQCVYGELQREFVPPEFAVIWTAKNNRYAPWDIEVTRNNARHVIVEVKSTTRRDAVSIGFMSQDEKLLLEDPKTLYRLYHVTLDAALSPKTARIRPLSIADLTFTPVKYRVDVRGQRQ